MKDFYNFVNVRNKLIRFDKLVLSSLHNDINAKAIVLLVGCWIAYILIILM